MSRRQTLKVLWAKRLQPLVGHKIVAIRYLEEKEEEELLWDRAAVVIQLDDGTLLFPSADDEGNGAGALFIQASKEMQSKGVEAAPVI